MKETPAATLAPITGLVALGAPSMSLYGLSLPAIAAEVSP